MQSPPYRPSKRLVRTILGARMVIDTRYTKDTRQYETSIDIFDPASNVTTRLFQSAAACKTDAWRNHIDCMQATTRLLYPFDQGERW